MFIINELNKTGCLKKNQNISLQLLAHEAECVQLGFDRDNNIKTKIRNLMKTLNTAKKLGLGLALTAVLAFQAGATGSWVAYTSPSGGSSTLSGYNLLVNEVLLSSSTLINELGAYDASGFGGNSVSVAVYNLATGAIITPVATFTGSPTTVGNYAYQSIAPQTLAGGLYAVVASGYNTVDFNSAATLNLGLQAGTIQGNGTVGSPMNFFAFTQLDTIAGAGTFGYNFVPAPEVSEFALAAVALLGLVYVGRLYSQKLKLA
jgi:hypothetical protein